MNDQKISNEDEIFHEGYQEGASGLNPYQESPYEQGTLEDEIWLDGYESGYEDLNVFEKSEESVSGSDHSEILENWSLPTPPEGFTEAVAIYQDGDVILDWTREPERDFSSEYDLNTHIEWPFKKGVSHVKDGKPNKTLWKSVKIKPIW